MCTAGGLGLFCAFEELFTGKWRQFDQRPDSFAESQATLARMANEVAIDRGEHLLECIQGTSFFLCYSCVLPVC